MWSRSVAKKRSEEQILADLALTTSAIGELAVAYERRVALFREARSLVPPVTHRRLAEVAGVSEVAVIQQLRRAEASTG